MLWRFDASVPVFAMVFVQIAVWSALLSLWCSSHALKTLDDQDAADADAVARCYSGPEQSVWELVMGKQIDIGAASSTLELAKKAGVGPGMNGVELNCNNGGGMRTLVRLAGVDSMIGVDLTKSVVETGKKRTEEEGLSDKIKFINKNSLENGLPDSWLVLYCVTFKHCSFAAFLANNSIVLDTSRIYIDTIFPITWVGAGIHTA